MSNDLVNFLPKMQIQNRDCTPSECYYCSGLDSFACVEDQLNLPSSSLKVSLTEGKKNFQVSFWGKRRVWKRKQKTENTNCYYIALKSITQN